MRNILITGGAGFIGSSLISYLLAEGKWNVTCIDNFDDFYNPDIKRKNLAEACVSPNFKLFELDIRNWDQLLENLTDNYDVIIHLAAKAGIQPSIQNPVLYQQVNIGGTNNLLEFAKVKGIKQFVFASSSSVYGINPNQPWSEDEMVLRPISPYASTKVACELLGYTYSHLYKIRFLALRLFTVYGPRQRPDLAIHKFAKSILNNDPVTIYGKGNTGRDYTFVDDIVKGIRAAIDYDLSMYEIINLGNSCVVKLIDLVNSIEQVFDKKARIIHVDEKSGDVPITWSNINKAKNLLNYLPGTSFNEGLIKFKNWLLLQTP